MGQTPNAFRQSTRDAEGSTPDSGQSIVQVIRGAVTEGRATCARGRAPSRVERTILRSYAALLSKDKPRERRDQPLVRRAGSHVRSSARSNQPSAVTPPPIERPGAPSEALEWPDERTLQSSAPPKHGNGFPDHRTRNSRRRPSELAAGPDTLNAGRGARSAIPCPPSAGKRATTRLSDAGRANKRRSRVPIYTSPRERSKVKTPPPNAVGTNGLGDLLRSSDPEGSKKVRK